MTEAQRHLLAMAKDVVAQLDRYVQTGRLPAQWEISAGRSLTAAIRDVEAEEPDLEPLVLTGSERR